MANLTPKPKVVALARAVGTAITAAGLIALPSDGCATQGVAGFDSGIDAGPVDSGAPDSGAAVDDAGPDTLADAGPIDASLDAAPDSGEFVGI